MPCVPTEAVPAEIRRLRPGDDALVISAPELFDHPPRPDATAKFLASDTHHLLMAFDGAGDGERAVGFVTGVETTHPDKGTEMFLYEVGVDERFRGRGVGTGLVSALRDLAVQRGCYGMWVLTDAGNAAALAAYAACGAGQPAGQLMLTWELGPDADGLATSRSVR